MKRWQEFGLFTLIYALSIVVGLYVTSFIEGAFWIKLLTFDLVMTFVVFLFSLIVKNSSLYDPYWSVIPPVLMLYTMFKFDAFGLVNILMLIAITIWAIRLTYNWAVNWHSFDSQDWRYDLIKEKTKKFYPLAGFLSIMVLPTLVVFAQIIVAYKIIEANVSLSLFTIMFSIIIVLATILQGVADIQMRDFRKNKTDKRVIDSGIWKYTRHPNYLAEILVWWAVYGIYVGVFKTFDLMILAPLIMTALFLFISIPLMETKMKKGRPEYEVYIKETSMLIPLPKRKVNEEA